MKFGSNSICWDRLPGNERSRRTWYICTSCREVAKEVKKSDRIERNCDLQVRLLFSCIFTYSDTFNIKFQRQFVPPLLEALSNDRPFNRIAANSNIALRFDARNTVGFRKIDQVSTVLSSFLPDAPSIFLLLTTSILLLHFRPFIKIIATDAPHV